MVEVEVIGGERDLNSRAMMIHKMMRLSLLSGLLIDGGLASPDTPFRQSPQCSTVAHFSRSNITVNTYFVLPKVESKVTQK